jgi:DNA-binding PadR family transcriptional regulator
LKVPFYLLGLLIRYGPQHGYKLKQKLGEISDFTKIKLPTIYYHLERMEENEFLTAASEREGNRPERTVYTITDLGKEHFKNLLKKLMNEKYAPEFGLDGVLYFFEAVNKDDFVNILISKKSAIEKMLQTLCRHQQSSMQELNESSKRFAGAIFNHHIYHLEAEIKWIETVVKEVP